MAALYKRTAQQLMPYKLQSHSQRMAKQRGPAEQKQYDKDRGSASKRGYDRAWQRLRKWFLNRYPLCQETDCQAAAAEVHHVIPISERPDLRLDQANLMSLCKSCHSAKTAKTLFSH